MTDPNSPRHASAEVIRQYWDQRAREQGASHTATTNDAFLRELEIRTCVQVLKALGIVSGDSFMDIGCGDGYSTLAVLSALPGAKAIGIDYNPDMIQLASWAASERPDLASQLDRDYPAYVRVMRSLSNRSVF